MEDTVSAENTFQVKDLTLDNALQSVFQSCRNHDKLLMGATQVTKSLIRIASKETDKPALVVLAKDLESDFQTIIISQCQRLDIPVIFVEDRAALGSLSPVRRMKTNGACLVLAPVWENREWKFVLDSVQAALNK